MLAASRVFWSVVSAPQQKNSRVRLARRPELVFFVRCPTKELYEAVKLEAERRNMSASAFIRAVLVEELDFNVARKAARGA